jgi:hypothetical protein
VKEYLLRSSLDSLISRNTNHKHIPKYSTNTVILASKASNSIPGENCITFKKCNCNAGYARIRNLVT